MTFGFIITRHVNSEKTNLYWNQCVKLLRLYYPNNKIVLIDDNSNKDLVKSEFDYENLQIIHSEFKGRGELLPYIYYLKEKWFDKAVIIHDSVFFNAFIDFDKLTENVLPLWFFYNNNSELHNVHRIAGYLNNNNIIHKYLLNWHKLNTWVSCFGTQCFITHDFLMKLNNIYNISALVDVIKNRSDRCALERIFGILFYIETQNKKSLLGCINDHRLPSRIKKNEYTFDEYISDFYKKTLSQRIIKVWTGR
jgi:hypothetical protein